MVGGWGHETNRAINFGFGSCMRARGRCKAGISLQSDPLGFASSLLVRGLFPFFLDTPPPPTSYSALAAFIGYIFAGFSLGSNHSLFQVGTVYHSRIEEIFRLSELSWLLGACET